MPGGAIRFDLLGKSVLRGLKRFLVQQFEAQTGERVPSMSNDSDDAEKGFYRYLEQKFS